MSLRLSFPARLPLITVAATLLIVGASAVNAAKLDDATRAKAAASIKNGLEFLAKAQKEDGSWSTAEMPGMSGLAIQSFVLAPESARPPGDTLDKGLGFIRSSAKPDGGIYNKGLANYNTSIALTTLLRAGKAEDQVVIDKARKFLVGAQKGGEEKPSDDGGFGYEPDGKRSRPDLDNTVFAVEALAMYRDKNPGKELENDLDWQAAIDFVSRCQNLTATNPAEWASDEPAEKGGFTYSPEGGQGNTRSYGTMTYSGLLSLVHAKVGASDPRVKAAVEWLSKRFSVDENPGMGDQGLYYYYFVMAKTLDVSGIEELEVGGKKMNWREDLAKKLISLQREDGSWANSNGRWMEQDPVLASSYSLNALAIICGD